MGTHVSRPRPALTAFSAAAGPAAVCLLLAGGLAWVSAGEPLGKPPPVKQPFGMLFTDTPMRVSSFDYLRRHPSESLADRLAYETRRPKGEAPVLSEDAVNRLAAFEQGLGGGGESNVRSNTFVHHQSLGQFHANRVDQFAQNNGFGQARTEGLVPEFLELGSAPTFEFADVPELNSVEEGKRETLPKKGLELAANKLRLPSLERLNVFNKDGEVSFLNPVSFGLVKDRTNVAGFQAHQFRYLPELADATPPPKGKETPKERERWAIRQLQLVSLLKHDQPAVYVSQQLPRMQDLKKVDTRPLTDFEEEALKGLRAGEDVVAEANTNRIRMVGAIRAAKQCLECHSVQRGDLLGAFTYDLQRDPLLETER